MSTVSYSSQAITSNEDAAELYIYSLGVENNELLTNGWDSARVVDFDESARHENGGLLTDSRIDDKFIVFQPEPNFKRSAKYARHQAGLLEHFSVPTCNGCRRLFRCSQSDLADLIEWLNFQQFEKNNFYYQPSFAVLDDPEALSADDLSRCSFIIGQLLQSRTFEDLQLILLASYIVANSYRELESYELASAVHEAARSRFQGDSDFISEDNKILRRQKLLKIVWAVLQVNKGDRISFNDPSMKRFLQSVSLPGVERGHGTMAQLCLGEIQRFGSALIVQPWHRFRKWIGSCSDWPLMRYATRYWSCHVREASPSRPYITAQLFRMLNHGVAGMSPSDTPVYLQRKVVEIGYSVSKVYDLPCLASLYENLGAVGNSTLFEMPTKTELLNLRLIHHQSIQPARSDNHFLPFPSKNLPHNSTDLIPDFDMLQISSQGRPEYSDDSEHMPEDLDWEQIEQSGHRSINSSKRSCGESWTVVTHTDYDIR